MDRDKLMKFLGYDLVEVGYFGDKSETEWQKANEGWMEKVGLTNVGRFYVNTAADDFIEFSPKIFKDWNWMVKVWHKLRAKWMPCEIGEAQRQAVELIDERFRIEITNKTKKI